MIAADSIRAKSLLANDNAHLRRDSCFRMRREQGHARLPRLNRTGWLFQLNSKELAQVYRRYLFPLFA